MDIYIHAYSLRPRAQIEQHERTFRFFVISCLFWEEVASLPHTSHCRSTIVMGAANRTILIQTPTDDPQKNQTDELSTLSLKEYTLHSFIRSTANTTSEQLSNMKKFLAYTLPSTHPHQIPCIGIEPTTTDKSQRPVAQKFESNISTNISTDYLTAAAKRQIFWNNRFII